ncbi:hypothetical protein H310_05722 [Aphanomyces invadans]|uniref:ATPase AAA-type core domain-containing protein n=1 Tax=Aphanomyces invadans TaxID=157072 RepID=A0A024U797_9STRA|nr:hypothetical protein H310_05722 [Aphanomyces invadans]ETW02149.1 hypothetical protein H310_05722 [Aphanomyces invadans]|eukprot:XP_008868754.1 hypothetical protein H310_05722 [Aphanomyces invadans]
MRGVARWLQMRDDDDDDGDDEQVEDIESEEDDGEFVDGVTLRKDATKKGKTEAAALTSKKARQKKGQDGDKGQLRMSSFVKKASSPCLSHSSPGAHSPHPKDHECSNGANATVVSIHDDSSNISITDGSPVQEEKSGVIDATEKCFIEVLQHQRDDTRAALPGSDKDDTSVKSNDVDEAAVSPLDRVDDSGAVVKLKSASKRKPWTDVDSRDVKTREANETPLKKQCVMADADASKSTEEITGVTPNVQLAPACNTAIDAAPKMMAMGRPKRKAVMDAAAKVVQNVEIVDATVARRAPIRLKTLRRANANSNDCIFVNPPPLSKTPATPIKETDDCVLVDPPASSNVFGKTPKKAASTSLFFLTTEQRDVAKRQEAALLEEQRQIEAMLKFQKDLDRRKALDVSFFAGRKVNPFFQPQKPHHMVTILDDDDSTIIRDTNAPPSTSGIFWKKESAALFPALSHVNALPPLVPTIIINGSKPRRAKLDPIVTLDDDEDSARAHIWPQLRHHQHVRLQLQAPLDDIFWCVVPATPPTGQIDDITTTPQYLHWHEFFQQLPRGDASLLVDKYAPRSSQGVVGNKHSVKWLCEWLRAWKIFRDGKSLRRVCEQYHDLFAAKTGADGTYLSDDDDDPSDELHRVFVLQGESGTGKTCCVYACAQEFGYEVLEINAGQPRSGKHLVELAGEATQSRRVVQTVHLLDAPVAKSATKKHKKGKKKREDVPLSTTSQTLVLLEDVDLLFEADKGFMTALNQIAKHARCPIVLTCKDMPDNFPPSLGHVKRTFSRPSQIEFQAYLTAVVRNQPSLVTPGEIAIDRLFHVCDGDIRRALHLLQVHGRGTGHTPTAVPVRWTCAALVPPIDAAITLAASAASHDKDLLSSAYLEELVSHFPHDKDKKIEQLAEFLRLDAIADSLSLCDVWSTTTTRFSAQSFEDGQDCSNHIVHSEFLHENLQDVTSSVRLQACHVTFHGRAKSATTDATCIQYAMDSHLRHRKIGNRRRMMAQCIRNLDATLAPIKGTTVALQGQGAVVDTIPMMSKLASVDASTHQHKRRSSNRHGYLNKILSDVQVVASIESCTRFGPALT